MARSLPSIKMLGIGHFLTGLIARGLVFAGWNRGALYFSKRHSIRVRNYLERHYHRILDHSETPTALRPTKIANAPIWVFWWQGESSAPALVQTCIRSIRTHANGHDVIVLDKDNYADYAHLPDYVTEKRRDGIITVQQFSDILRLNLINRYGGLWMDATIFLTRPLPEYLLSLPFFTARTRNGGRWCGFFMGGGPHNCLIDKTYKLILAYWERENALIDYFLIDYLLDYVYRHFDSARRLIEAVPANNPDILFFVKQGDDRCDETVYRKLLEENFAFKLTWKKPIGTISDSYSDRLLSDFAGPSET